MPTVSPSPSNSGNSSPLGSPFSVSCPASNPTSRKSRWPKALATDISYDSNGGGEDETRRDMIERMRVWCHDALMQHLYETAAFWGDKILSWTNDPSDAFWLAQAYFMTHQYSRAERLLTRPFLTSQLASTAAKEKEQDASNPTIMPRLPMGPGGIIEVDENMQNDVSRLIDMSVACRYLVAQCQMRQGNWADATEMLGEANPFRNSGKKSKYLAIPNLDGGIKIEASMCHLRGILMQKLNRGDKAKQCFMEALAIDVNCFDAFERLVSGEMMTPDEEWEFVESLASSSQAFQDTSFVQLIYTARLRKYKHAAEHALTRQRLVEEYRLGDNPDVLFSFADTLYAGCRWADCFAITTRILELAFIHDATTPLHIACMYHLPHLHSKLFIVAHEMVDRVPENPMSWYAVGVWYLSNRKWPEARQYFSKTSLMEPRFGPAWVAFAHTFALEGEHGRAVTAYSTCARMFTGSHLPLMFVGMENIALLNHKLANEALNAAHSMCDGDPLLLNELGVMAFNHKQVIALSMYERAAELFQHALDLAQVAQSSQATWATTYLNLGTCFRKLNRCDEAQGLYRKVLDLDPRHPVALGFMGMIYHLTGRLDDAIVKYHQALSVDQPNPHVTDLLQMALDQTARTMPKVPEFKQTLRYLREKYRHGDKLKGRAPADVPSGMLAGHIR
ncbi:hypothetical protein B0H11DRAFT_1766350 [Mycena galericulata]|nr:hypothetical protein B0H11DRAFT_1766350 [Mycena galericulata]